MRKLLMLLVVAAAPALMAPQLAAAPVKPTEQELLVTKKKKAEAARKSEARKKAEAARKAKLNADTRKKVMARRLTPEKKRPQPAQRRNCGDFLNCLFGGKPRSGVQRASTGSVSRDYATAEVVNWNGGGKYAPGSLVVRTPERALYLVMNDGQARRYSVGVGRDGFQWSGNSRIVNKAEWPTWRPPQVMIKREAAKGHFLPDMMEGGPDNPLGARALYIGGTMFRIHGTNNAASIGGAVSSGCIRMMNTDVIDLYDRVRVGARVYVYQ